MNAAAPEFVRRQPACPSPGIPFLPNDSGPASAAELANFRHVNEVPVAVLEVAVDYDIRGGVAWLRCWRS
jgi:hypothetical protein